MTDHSTPKTDFSLKAGALLCPVCCVEYIEVLVNFDIDGTIIKNVKVLRCPVCKEEQLTPQMQEDIEKRLRSQE